MRRFRARAWIPAYAGMTEKNAGMTYFSRHSKHEQFAVSSRVWNPCSKDCFVSELSGFEGKSMDPSLRWDDGKKCWDDGIKRWDDGDRCWDDGKYGRGTV